MNINETSKVLWAAVNAAAQSMKLTFAERRLYERLDTGLHRFAAAMVAERAEGWSHPEINTTELRPLATAEVLKLLHDTVVQNDTAPLSQAEFDFFLVMDQAVELYPYEARNGRSEPRMHCRICGRMFRDCIC